MKYAIYILAALLAATVAVLILLNMVEYIGSGYDTPNNPFYWYTFITNIFDISIILIFAVLSLIQLKKTTPRLILIFSGYMVLCNISFALQIRWWFALCIVAGLLSAVYEFVKHGIRVKKAPFHAERYGRLLIFAGILACINIAYGIYSAIKNMPYNGLYQDIPIFYYSSFAVGIVIGICIPVFCFIQNRRTGVLFRMFFIGPSALNGLLFPVSVVFYLIQSDYFSFDPLSIIGSVLSVSLAALVLIHAFKTRHDPIIPHDSEDSAEPVNV